VTDLSAPFPDAGPRRQATIFVAGLGGRKPRVPVDAARLETSAQRALSPEAFAYIAGGAGLERTVAANRAAFDQWRIVPRMLRDVSQRDLSVELFGTRLPAPLLLAPIGVLEMAHREADLAVARAAARLGIPMVFSSAGSVPMETCAQAMGGSPRWFQLYWTKSDELAASFVRRAEACGCGAIVLTLDTTMLAWRPRDLELGYVPFIRARGIAQFTSDPTFRASLAAPAATEGLELKPPLTLSTITAFAEMVRRYPGGLVEKLRSGAPRAAVRRFLATFARPSLTWDNVATLRRMTKLPVLLKGILHPDDARRAVDHGVNGVIVSNHGGRQVDGAIAALDALPHVVAAVGDRDAVLFDSGVRTGADVFKALALGARAVLIGRPYVYGLALAGEAGVREVLENLIADFDLTVGLAGCRTPREITREMLVRASEGT